MNVAVRTQEVQRDNSRRRGPWLLNRSAACWRSDTDPPAPSNKQPENRQPTDAGAFRAAKNSSYCILLWWESLGLGGRESQSDCFSLLTLDPICPVVWARFTKVDLKCNMWATVCVNGLVLGWTARHPSKSSLRGQTCTQHREMSGGNPCRCDHKGFNNQKATWTTVLEQKHSASSAHPCWLNTIWMPRQCFLEVSNLSRLQWKSRYLLTSYPYPVDVFKRWLTSINNECFVNGV